MNKTLTKRDNLLRILQHGKGEWVPCCFHSANPRNIPGQLPKELLKEPLDFLAISKYLGGDILHEISPRKTSHPSNVNIEFRSHQDKNLTVNETLTPVGSLRSIIQTTIIPPANLDNIPAGTVDVGPETINTISSHPVKSIEDYKTIRYIYEHMDFSIDVEAIERALGRVGDDGVLVVNVGMPSPLYSMIDHFVGLEKFIYDFYDFPEEVEKTMTIMAEKSYECYQQIVSASPAAIIRCTEDLDAQMISPDLFAKYSAPVLAKYSKICHQHNKTMMVHSCGHIKQFLPEFRKSEIDAIHCLCPPPVGNTPITHAHEVLGENTVMMVRPDPNMLKSQSPAEVSLGIGRMLNEAKGMNNVMLIVPPGRAPLENLQVVLKTVDEFNQ
ncbi:MAG: hypothetical protein KAS17_06155 [Victivallaceae bacterium]|nr:hypothetical protein [Victivallaceae bacterium]